MLDRLVIKNFKGIGEPGVDLELKPLTLLVGPNRSGKSSILEALAIFTQSIERDKLQTWGELIKAGPEENEAIPVEELLHSKSSQLELVFYKAPLEYRYVYDQASKKSYQLLREADQIFESKWSGPILSAGWGQQANLAFAIRDRAEEMERTFFDCLHRKVFYTTALRGRIEPSAPAADVPGWTGPQGERLIQLRQILTIITNLLWCRPGSIFLIEEPEISLHPEAQVKICELFAESIAQQKQIIATTHSHFLLSALGIPVQERRLRPEDIAVYHVEKKSHGTVAERLPMNEKGYIEGWIPSFADVEKRLLREWVKTIPEE